MRSVLLMYGMYGDEQAEAGLSPEEFNELVQAYFRYDDELQQAGKYIFTEALQPSSTTPCSGSAGGQPQWPRGFSLS